MTIRTPEQVADLAYRAGFRGNALAVMVAICGAESNYDDQARGDVGIQTSVWGPSVGLPQVRTLKAERGKGTDRDELALLADPFFQLKAAYHISGGGAHFTPWSTYTNGKYQRYMGASTPSAGVVTARGPSPDAWTGAPLHRTDDKLRPISSYADSDVVSPGLPFTIRGRAFPGSLDEYVVDGEVDLQTGQVWQITFTVDDPGLALYKRGLFGLGTPIDTADIQWKVAAVEVKQGPANEQVTVTLRTRGSEDAKQDRSARTEKDSSAFVYVSNDARQFGLTTTGGKVDRTPYATRSSIGRNPANTKDPLARSESAWESWQRLAGEVGAWVWEAGYGILYFGAPRRIMANSIGFRVVWRGEPAEEHLAPMECPSCRRTNDDPLMLAEVNVKLPPARGRQVRPGMALNLEGVPGFEESFIVTKVHWKLDGNVQPVEVTAVTPRDPIPTDDAEKALDPQVTAATPVANGTKSALDFVTFCLKQAGKAYVYGAEADLDDPDPKAFDCSELVQWACAQVGVAFPDGSGNQWAAIVKAKTKITLETAYATRGALLFRGAGGSEHVAIALGDGKTTIEARGRRYGVLQVAGVASRGFTLAGLIPGLLYGGKPAGERADALLAGKLN